MKSLTLKVAMLLAAVIMLNACKKDLPMEKDPITSQPSDVKTRDLKVPAGFNFETFKDLTVKVTVENPSFSGERFRINIYNDAPATGNLITSGYTDVSNNFTTDVRVPAGTKTLWIERVGANGNKVAEEVSADKFINKSFKKSAANLGRKSGGSGMTCNTGCTRTVNNATGNQTVSSAETVCFTGTMSGAKITINGGGVIKVCASGSIDELKMNGNAEAYILENTIITLKDLQTNGSSTIVKNYSDSLKVTDDFELNGYIENQGKIYASQNMNVQSNGDFRNYGTIKVTGDMEVNKLFYNYGKITVTGDFENRSNADFKNYCYLYVKGNATNNGDLYIYEYVRTDKMFEQNSSGDTYLDDAALLSCKDLKVNKEMEGTGSNTSTIKVSATTTIYTNGKIKGKLELCDANGIETNNGSIVSPAVAACNNYIATSDCNTEGTGTAPVQDTDNDGVADAQDEYPNDATRAFNSYYPSATTYASLAYEDLWPSKGDFDFNDMVLGYRITKVLNAGNKVVELYNTVFIRAMGAGLDNGYGFQLDGVNATEVSSVYGLKPGSTTNITLNANKTEAGNTKAVVIAWTYPEGMVHRAPGSMFNTIKTNGLGTSDTIYIRVRFNTPIDQSKVTQDKFNPFILVNQTRNHEVHLGNFAPTAKMNNSYFNTFDDASNSGAGVYYKTAGGVPFAIEISEDFAWPVEKADISTAYNNFNAWAISGGATNVNWYKDLPGNRNSENIY